VKFLHFKGALKFNIKEKIIIEICIISRDILQMIPDDTIVGRKHLRNKKLKEIY